jgi:cysteine-rich repeat protein
VSELACRVGQGVTRTNVDVASGDVVFVVVDGFEADSEADFTLSVQTRLANQCGDGFVDEAEQCDDDNLVNGDGCGDDCNVESKETEPNDTQAQSTTFDDPQYASIDPAGDVDYYTLQVSDGPRLVTINTFNLGAGYCSQLLMDPQLELFSNSGELLASDDDAGDGYCAKISSMLDTGDYHIVVRESDDPGQGARSTFPYRLGVTIQ